MARGSRSSRSSGSRPADAGQDVLSYLEGPPLRRVDLVADELSSMAGGSFADVEDRRRYVPSAGRQVLDRPGRRLVSGLPARVQAARHAPSSWPARYAPDLRTPEASLFQAVPGALEFREPSRVVLCVRRSVRRQVLFASRKTGRGAGSGKPRRRTADSDVSCRSAR